jgi:hypothetical protein
VVDFPDVIERWVLRGSTLEGSFMNGASMKLEIGCA